MKTLKTTLCILTLGIIAACGNANGNTEINSSKAQSQSNRSPTTISPTSITPPAVSGEYSAIAKNLTNNLIKSGINAQIESIVPTAMPDMFMVTLTGMTPIFTDKTGTYIIQGEIVKLGGERPVNITSQLQATLAKKELEAVDKSEMIIYPAKGTKKAAIYVFSDPTCHYCQMLHKEIEQTTANGIEVRYLAWPRSEQVIPMTESIWCNANRHKALTDAKHGKMPEPISCDNPVQKHIALGFKIGVSGTPAIFSESGEQIGGYLPSDELAKVAISSAKN